tara:strand:- start:106 stop:546 length:441 start_codon:yes stop_codon:yes gene_type:complete
MELDKIKTKCNIIYYKTISDNLKRNKISNKFIESKLQSLKDNETTITENENNRNSSKEIVYSNDYLYKKAWSRLSEIHKIIKIKEFILKLLIEKEDDKKDLENKLINLVKQKILTKKDRVKYDNVKGRIISIVDLKYNNGKYYINL